MGYMDTLVELGDEDTAFPKRRRTNRKPRVAWFERATGSFGLKSRGFRNAGDEFGEETENLSQIRPHLEMRTAL